MTTQTCFTGRTNQTGYHYHKASQYQARDGAVRQRQI